MEIQEIDAKTAFQQIEEGALLVDVREDHEVEEISYDVKHFMHIPLGELPTRFQEIPKDKNIIMACRSGARSMRAAQFLALEGYSEIVNLKAGILGWVENGMATK